MTQKPSPLPAAGGSFIREKDGTLRPSGTPASAEAEPAPEKPATKGVKQPVKEA